MWEEFFSNCDSQWGDCEKIVRRLWVEMNILKIGKKLGRINIPIQIKSPILLKAVTSSNLVSLLFLLLAVFRVTALYKTPNATPKAPKMPKMAVSTGIPSGQ